MILRIQDNESKSNLGLKLNKQLLKCYEKIQFSQTRQEQATGDFNIEAFQLKSNEITHFE